MIEAEEILKAKIDDAIRLSKKGTRFVGFLNPSEAALVKNYVKHNRESEFAFWGGFADAERVLLGVHRHYDPEPDFPITPITFRFRSKDILSHRDFLGALMAEGVVRASVGDILIEAGRAVVFVKKELSDYFLHGISKVGRIGVECFSEAEEPLPAAHTFEELSGVVASERLDCLVAFFSRLSREKVSALIASGAVFVNHKEIRSVSHSVKESDQLSIRSLGKFSIDKLGPVTKKGRLALTCRKYK